MDKILVVDDDRDILTVVEILLGMNNYSVRTISRWQQINNEIQDFSPDLILLDVSLGGADGRDICKQLKVSDDTSHIPIILFSAHHDLVNNIKGCGADGLVTKPFETSFLLDTIRKNIDNNN
jgi:DNA-binding response OmpR family regulator